MTFQSHALHTQPPDSSLRKRWMQNKKKYYYLVLFHSWEPAYPAKCSSLVWTLFTKSPSRGFLVLFGRLGTRLLGGIYVMFRKGSRNASMNLPSPHMYNHFPKAIPAYSKCAPSSLNKQLLSFLMLSVLTGIPQTLLLRFWTQQLYCVWNLTEDAVDDWEFRLYREWLTRCTPSPKGLDSQRLSYKS